MFHTRSGVAWIPEGSQISQPSSCWNALDETYLIYFPLRLWNQGGKPRKALVRIVTRAKDSSPAKRQATCSDAPRPGSTSPTSKIQQIFATNFSEFSQFVKNQIAKCLQSSCRCVLKLEPLDQIVSEFHKWSRKIMLPNAENLKQIAKKIDIELS